MLNPNLSTQFTGWDVFRQNIGTDFSIPKQATGLSNIENKIVDVLGASVWNETYHQTFAYRWKGKDTLTWGNLDEWIRVHWIRNWVHRYQKPYGNPLEQDKFMREVIQSAKIARVETMYTLRNALEVKAFLVKHPNLMQLLFEAKEVLENFFGATEIAMELVSDLESSNSKKLFAYVSTKLSPSEALASLDAFDEAWFLKQVNWVGDLLNFSLESV